MANVEYKMRRGKNADIETVREAAEDYFGETTGSSPLFDNLSELQDDDTVYAVEEPHVEGMEWVIIGVRHHTSKKDTVILYVNRADVKTLIDRGITSRERIDEISTESINARNSFLKATTGRSEEQRKNSMKRD